MLMAPRDKPLANVSSLCAPCEVVPVEAPTLNDQPCPRCGSRMYYCGDKGECDMANVHCDACGQHWRRCRCHVPPSPEIAAAQQISSETLQDGANRAWLSHVRSKAKRAWPERFKEIKVPIKKLAQKLVAKGGVLTVQHAKALWLRQESMPKGTVLPDGWRLNQKQLQIGDAEALVEPSGTPRAPPERNAQFLGELATAEEPAPVLEVLDLSKTAVQTLPDASRRVVKESWQVAEVVWEVAKLASPAQLLSTIDTALSVDPPMEGQPARFANEISLPVPEDFEWPKFEFVVIMSHTCVMRHTWSVAGLIGCSVASRRTILEPAPGCFHFMCDVHEFLATYPYVDEVEQWDAHPTCGKANNASRVSWRAKILDGSMLRSALEMGKILKLPGRVSMEQPPTAMKHFLGEPTVKFNALDTGSPRFKDVWYWLKNLPTPLITRAQKDGVSHAHSSKVGCANKELTTLLRSTSDPHVARILCSIWNPRVLPPLEAKTDSPFVDLSERAIRHRHRLFAASYAPTLPLGVQEDSSQRAIVIVPMAFASCPVALVHLSETLGVLAKSNEATLRDQAVEACQCLLGGCEPYLAGYTRDAAAHAIFLLPVIDEPMDVLHSVEDIKGAREAKISLAWCSLTALKEEESLKWALQATIRFRQLFEPSPDSGLRIGIWQRAVQTVPHATATRWRQAAPSSTANAEWAAFIISERERSENTTRVWLSLDNEKGTLREWVANIKSAADFIAEIQPPPQGLPSFTDELLLSIEIPSPPPTISTKWLHSVPPQKLPPGFPEELDWSEVLKLWSREEIVKFLNLESTYCFDTYELTPEEAENGEWEQPSHCILGPGAFHMRAHANGIGEYCMNIAVLVRKPNGKLKTMKFEMLHAEHKDITFILETIKACLGDITDQELLCFLAQGARFKAHMPAEVRLLHNLVSLIGRGVKAAKTTLELEEKGFIQVVELCEAEQKLTANGPCPLIHLPGMKPPIGAVDKANDPSKGC